MKNSIILCVLLLPWTVIQLIIGFRYGPMGCYAGMLGSIIALSLFAHTIVWWQGRKDVTRTDTVKCYDPRGQAPIAYVFRLLTSRYCSFVIQVATITLILWIMSADWAPVAFGLTGLVVLLCLVMSVFRLFNAITEKPDNVEQPAPPAASEDAEQPAPPAGPEEPAPPAGDEQSDAE